MTPDDLRRLAEEATPGPWKCVPDSDHFIVFTPEGDKHACAWTGRLEDTRLIALAPDLARLCAEMGEALAEAQRILVYTRRDVMKMPGEQRSGAEDQVKRALAKLSELEAR
jgi:hypothetical protein